MQVDTNTLQALGLTGTRPTSTSNNLGQEDFLRLMTTQLNNQNPLKPQEHTEFLTQMAQFGTVAGIRDLQSSFTTFAGAIQQDRATAAANLVGRSALVASDRGVLESGGAIQGEVVLPADASSVRLRISDSAGRVVRVLDLGPQAGGSAPFEWHGEMDGSATPAAPGTYHIVAEAVVGGATVALESRVAAPVESVTLGSLQGGSQGMEVELRGLGRYTLDDLLAVY